MIDLDKVLEECKEKLYDIRAFCYDQAKLFDKLIKKLERLR